MSERSIRFYNRYRNAYEEEQVYGEWALRLLYGNPVGRTLGTALFARPFFSKLFGWYMRRPASRGKIRSFVETYNLNEDEFLESMDSFSSFNNFFCRRLKSDSRPIDQGLDSLVFPADGRHFGWQEIGSEEQVFVKGQRWNLAMLLDNDKDLLEKFAQCTLVLSRLCPVDYHHFHFPAAGKFSSQKWCGRHLNSVSPIALRNRLSYLWENKRCINLVESDSVGDYCIIEIGATNVGTIKHHPLNPDKKVDKGDPMGWFEFGGSSVITLFQTGKVQLSADLLKMTTRGTELYARMGDRMGCRA